MKKGFTLIELLVSMSVLSIVCGVAVAIFISAISEQRRIFSDKEIRGQLDYALEYMSRALRMASRDFTGECLGEQDKNYLLTHQDTLDTGSYLGIKFINQSNNNICQEFYLDKSGPTPIIREVKTISGGSATSSSLTSEKIKINSLKFIVAGQSDTDQPRVTIILDASLSGNATKSSKIQTTVSQRNLNIK